MSLLKACTTLGTVWQLIRKTKHTPSPRAIPLLDLYPNKMKTLCPQKDLHANVHSSFIHNSQKFETAQVSINLRMDKQTIIRLYM